MATIHDPSALTSTATKYLLSVYYDKLFLERLLPSLRWYQMADKKKLPKSEGKVIKFSAFKNLSVGSALTEATKPTPVVLSTFNVTATLRQYGGYAAVSDFLETTAISSVVTEAIQVLSEQSALTLDTYIRNVAFGGGFPSSTSRISAAARSRYTGSVSRLSAINGKVYGYTVQLVKAISSGVTKNFSGMGTLTTSAWANYKAVLRDIRQAVGTLRSRNVAPYSDGYYLGIAHPVALQQLMEDTQTGGWIDWNKYITNEPMMKGEVGRAEGVRWIASTNSMDRGANTTSNVSASFFTIVGKGALGVIDYDGVGDTQNGKNPTSLIIKRQNQYDQSDPLNQTAATIGWKIVVAGAVLNTSCGIHVMTLRA
jgi:N4-gp56 family major capsid protein